jgi:hypothetical protein
VVVPVAVIPVLTLWLMKGGLGGCDGGGSIVSPEFWFRTCNYLIDPINTRYL